MNESRFNWEAAKTNSAHDTSTNVMTKPGVSVPAGSARVWVRGLAASIEASARRFESHRRRSSRDHGDDDPDQCVSAGEAVCRQHGSAEREGKHEDRVLPFDHFESYAQVVENGHQ